MPRKPFAVAFVALSLILAAATAPRARADGERSQVSSSWVPSFAEGQRIARREGKDLLVNFSGTDWCIPCRELDDQVFSKPEFFEGASERFVLVTLDFPRNPAAQARVPDAAGNLEMQAKYGVTAFPTVLLMTADGDVYGSTGYRAGGPEKYLEHVLRMLKVNRKQMRAAVELAAAIDDAKPEARASLRAEAVRAVLEFPRDAPYADVLVPAVRAVLDAAARDDTATRTACLRALLRVRRGTQDDETAARALDRENKTGLFELAVDAACQRSDSLEAVKANLADIARLAKLGTKDDEVARDLWINATHWCHNVTGETELAKVYAKKARALAPTDPLQVKLLDEVLGVEPEKER